MVTNATQRREYLSLGLLLLVVTGAYLVLMPGNRSETDDGFGYAYAARFAPFGFDPDHALIVPVGRVLSTVGDSYAALVGFSFLCGLATLAMFYILMRSLALPVGWATWTVGLLAASYGFWRYSVEAETYTVGALLAVLLCVAAVRGWALPVLYVCAVCAVAGHILNVAVALVAVPAFLLVRQERRRCATFLLGAVPIAAVFVVTGLGSGPPADPPGWLDGVRIPVGFGQSLASANGLLSLPGAMDGVERAFGNRDLSGEQAIASSLSPAFGWLSLGLTVAVVAVGVVGIALVARGSAPVNRAGVVLFVGWLVAYMPAALRQERGNPELWVIALVPFWGLVGSLAGRVGLRPPVVLIALPVAIALHSAVVGFVPIQSPSNDANVIAGQWLIQNAGPEDLVLTDDNQVFTRYLRYQTQAQVVNVRGNPVEPPLHRAGRVFLTPSAQESLRWNVKTVPGAPVVEFHNLPSASDPNNPLTS